MSAAGVPDDGHPVPAGDRPRPAPAPAASATWPPPGVPVPVVPVPAVPVPVVPTLAWPPPVVVAPVAPPATWAPVEASYAGEFWPVARYAAASPSRLGFLPGPGATPGQVHPSAAPPPYPPYAHPASAYPAHPGYPVQAGYPGLSGYAGYSGYSGRSGCPASSAVVVGGWGPAPVREADVRRPVARGPLVLALVVGLVLVLVAAGALAGSSVYPGGTGTRVVASGGAGPAPSGSAPTPAPNPTATGSAARGAEVTDPAARLAAVRAVLDARGAAVTHHDEAAWSRTQTSDASAPRFSRLAVLPITRWSYALDSLDSGTGTQSLDVDLTLHLRYDVDVADALIDEHLVLRHIATGWRVVSERTGSDRAQPWDLGTLSVVQGTRSLVIGIDEPRSVLRHYADLADLVTPDVAATWGTDWNAHPVLMVPHSLSQLGRALGRSTVSLDDFAAVTVAETDRGGDLGTPQRIWTNTPGLEDVSPLGREVVLRHEITHVATAAPLTPSVPLWLEEGFAEYVGYDNSGVPDPEAWAELVTAVRAGKAPTHLPVESMFEGSTIDIAYESAHVACRLVVERWGEKALVRLYRLVRRGVATPERNLDVGLRAVTGSGTASFEALWRARMAALAPA